MIGRKEHLLPMKIKTMKQIVYLILAVTFLYACNDDEKLDLFEVDNAYVLPTGDSEFEQYQREVFTNYNSYLMADYSDKECLWDVDKIQNITVIRQSDSEVLNKMPELIEELFYSSYTKDFMKKYSPFKFLLADTVNTTTTSDEPVWVGRDYLLLSKVNDDLFEYSDEEKAGLKAKIHGFFWGRYRHKYERFLMSDGWYELAADNYYTSLKDLRTEQEVKDKVTPDPKKFGFWTSVKNGSYDFTPNAHDDIAQYVENIILLSDEELAEAIDGWPLMKQKVNIIKQFFVDEYNIDLSAI